MEPTIENISSVIAEALGVTVDNLKASSRKGEYVFARHLAMAYTKEYNAEMSLKSIGRWFGNRDRSTVSHAVDCFENYKEGTLSERMKLKKIEDVLMSKFGYVPIRIRPKRGDTNESAETNPQRVCPNCTNDAGCSEGPKE